MLNEILSIGDKIDVRRLNQNNKPVHNARTFVSQLVDFVDRSVIQVAAPIELGKIILLEVGESYNLCFYASKGLYQCNCTVLSNHKDNNMHVAVVRITTNLEKFQRRQYYRLECIHEIEYRLMTVEEELLERKLRSEEFKSTEEKAECRKHLDQLDQEWLPAAITDISGGGVRINSSIPHHKGDKIRLKLELIIGGELRKMNLRADVVSSGKILSRTGAYEHRVSFSDIMPKDREDLIKYIFEQERRRRRNEKN